MADADSAPSLPPRRGLSLTAIAIVLVIGAAGGGLVVLSWPQIFARVSSSLPFRIEANTVAAPVPPPPPTAYEARIAALEKHFADLTDATARLNAARYTVQDLDARVAKLEAQNAALVMRNAAATVALADLIRLSESGRPFAGQLDLLRGLLPDAPELQNLSRHAASGVPTEAMLLARFGEAAGAALAADRQANADGWLARLWQRMGGLVSIRRTGNVQGDDTESRLARAGHLIAGHDLSGTMDEMRALSPQARAAAKNWMDDAEARLATSRDSSALAARLARQLGAASRDVAP